MSRIADRDDDMPRDVHLLAALRHAPDRDAAPPPELSARILASAQVAAHSARAATPAPRRASLASRLSVRLLRPHLATAFGTLAVASLVALMWSTQEPPAVVSEPTSAAPTAAAEASRIKELALSPSTSADAAKTAAPVAKTLPKREPAAAPARQAKPAEADRVASRVATDSAAAPSENSTAGVAAIAPAAAVAPAVPPTAPPPAAAPPAERRAMADAALAGSVASKAAAPPVAQEGERGRLRQEFAAAPRARAQPTDPLASLDTLLRDSPPDLAWRRQGASLAHGEVQRRWWAALRDATRGRWTREVVAAEPLAPWLTLSIGERSVATLWLGSGKLVLREADGSWSVPLTEVQQSEWQEAVSRW